MYLNNPKELFKDLYDLPTMRCYMVACAEDGEDENLRNLLSIVGCNRGELHYGGEGSCRWDLEQYDTEKERQQVIKDSRTIDAIYRQIRGYVWFYSKRSKCITSALESDTNTNSKFKCFCNGTLSVYTMEEWCLSEGIDLKEITRYM